MEVPPDRHQDHLRREPETAKLDRETGTRQSRRSISPACQSLPSLNATVPARVDSRVLRDLRDRPPSLPDQPHRALLEILIKLPS